MFSLSQKLLNLWTISTLKLRIIDKLVWSMHIWNFWASVIQVFIILLLIRLENQRRAQFMLGCIDLFYLSIKTRRSLFIRLPPYHAHGGDWVSQAECEKGSENVKLLWKNMCSDTIVWRAARLEINSKLCTIPEDNGNTENLLILPNTRMKKVLLHSIDRQWWVIYLIV